MKSNSEITSNTSRSIPKWFLPFILLELAIAAGALLGVAVLNPSWLGGLGIGNLIYLITLGLVPAFSVAIIISKQREESIRGWTISLGFGVLVLSFIVSYTLGVAMVGI